MKVKAEFFEAARKGDLVTLTKYLDANPEAARAASGGMQAIHFAAQGNQLAAIELLVSRGTSVDAQDASGATAIMLAMWVGAEALLKPLLRLGANVNLRMVNGESPLTSAFRSEPAVRELAVPLLLAAGAEYGIPEAVSEGDLVRVRAIFEADPDALDRVTMIPLGLLRFLTFGSAPGGTRERMEIFKLLMAHGWKATTENLRYEADICKTNKKHEFMKLLRSAAASITAKASKGNATKPKGRAKATASPAPKEPSVEPVEQLCNAARDGDLEGCKRILRGNPDLIHEFFQGRQSLHFAAQENQAKIVELLLESGADIDALGDEYSHTPLHFAAEMCPDAARVLIEHGADLNPVDFRGYTPLALAIAYQSQESEQVIAMLREAGAAYGLTEAVAMGDLERVTAIFAEQRDALAKVPSQEVMLSLLLFVGNFGTMPDREKILALLLQHGLDVPTAVLLQAAKSCETSTIGQFGKLLRRHLAGKKA